MGKEFRSGSEWKGRRGRGGVGGAVVRAPDDGIRVELGDPQGGAATEGNR